jgi:hypothetical protein
MDPGGSFAVVWLEAPSSSIGGIAGRCYDAAGAPLGSAFLVSAYTTGGQVDPSVTLDGPGNLIVAWSGAGEGDPDGVYARRIACAPPTAASADPAP